MIRINDIAEQLLPLIGWEQNYDTTDLKIAEYLTESESGLYFQQAHPLLTLQNISCIAPIFDIDAYPEYDPNLYYTKGDIVVSNGELYKANEDVDSMPAPNSSKWLPTNPLSEWLERKTKASIIKAITRYCTEKEAEKTAKALCENRTLFDGTGRLVDTVKNKKNFVGFEVVPVRSMGVTTAVNKIGLQFKADRKDALDDYIHADMFPLPIYLFHSSRQEPFVFWADTFTIQPGFVWLSFSNMFMPYISNRTDAGGSWYLGYFQSDLEMLGLQAIRKDKDWSKEPCQACSRRDVLAWQAWSKYIEVHPFYVNEELVDTGIPLETPEDAVPEEREQTTLWDVEYNQYTYDNNYGLNLEITVACDLTDFIIQQRGLFKDIIMKQVAVDMLREFAYNANVRTNRHSINASRVDILYEIDGDSASMKKSGLAYQLELAFKAIKLNTMGIDRICLPCKNNGVKYRTV